jgi:hypothetical protein
MLRLAAAGKRQATITLYTLETASTAAQATNIDSESSHILSWDVGTGSMKGVQGSMQIPEGILRILSCEKKRQLVFLGSVPIWSWRTGPYKLYLLNFIPKLTCPGN